MLKIINSALLIILISFEANGYLLDKNDTSRKEILWSEKVIEYKLEVRKIKQDGAEIHELFSIFDLMVVEETYRQLTEDLSGAERMLQKLENDELSTKKNEFFDVYESVLNSYNKLITLYDFYSELEDKKEEWSNEYFKLWEQTYSMKTRIDNLYVKEEKMNVHYGGMNDYKYKSIRKRNIYEACTNIFNTGLLELKSTGDCDHYDRIQILDKLLPVMRKCEKLAYTYETRDLEKDLKREEDTRVMAELIINFEFTK